MPLEIVFLEPQNGRPLKPHYQIPITAFTATRFDTTRLKMGTPNI